MQVTLAVLLYNASPYLQKLTESVDKQSVAIGTRLAVYTRSNDDSLSQIEQFFDEVIKIEPNNFDHGGTRQIALDECQTDIVVFLTQDVILKPNALEEIINSFNDPTVGCAYGRQLPHDDATAFAQHLRYFNYPEHSQVKSLSDVQDLGITTCFNSNSFSAYRVSALKSVGGFPEKNIVGEDVIAAVRLLNAGWKIAYNAKAQVYHSHNYTLIEEFKRYFDTGEFHRSNAALLLPFQTSTSRGKAFVLSEVKYLIKNHYWYYLPFAFLRTIIKWSAYKLGRASNKLSKNLSAKGSAHVSYWTIDS